MIKSKINITVVLLSLLTLCQSCRVYKHQSVSLTDAYNSKKRVKLKTVDKDVLIYKRIEFRDSTFFGVKKKNGLEIFEPIDPDQIAKVRLHNKTLSIIYGTLIGITGAIVVVGVIGIFTFSGDFLGGSIGAPN